MSFVLINTHMFSIFYICDLHPYDFIILNTFSIDLHCVWLDVTIQNCASQDKESMKITKLIFVELAKTQVGGDPTV